ncbi:MAG: hydrogenase maturation protease [Deltaproteobacteria bacterium]|nr:hydrogenase maturation protease [Deltaproteobacteria bacterium]
MRRIICIGNRYVSEDSAGPRVYDHLRLEPLPVGVEAVDGGLAGLDLLGCADGAERLVFVDAVVGLGAPDGVAELVPAAIAATAGAAFGHAAGLPYLLRALPLYCEGPAPEVRVVGVEGPADNLVVRRAAALALRLACAPGGSANG